MSRTLNLETLLPQLREPQTTRTLSDDRPHPDMVRGRCPECGDDLVSQMYAVGTEGYLIVWECWGARGETPRCTYRHVL